MAVPVVGAAVVSAVFACGLRGLVTTGAVSYPKWVGVTDGRTAGRRGLADHGSVHRWAGDLARVGRPPVFVFLPHRGA